MWKKRKFKIINGIVQVGIVPTSYKNTSREKTKSKKESEKWIA